MKKKTSKGGRRRAPSRTRIKRIGWRGLVAHHESAHAVANCRFGFDLYGVSVVQHEDALGATSGSGGLGYDLETAKGRVTSLLAGYAANLRNGAAEPRARAGAQEDFEAAEELYGFLQIDEAQAIDWAEAFVEEPKNWRAIEEIAEQLLARKRLDGEEVEIMVEVADGVTSSEDLERYRLMAAHVGRGE